MEIVIERKKGRRMAQQSEPMPGGMSDPMERSAAATAHRPGMLTFAAVCLGVVVGLERRASGGVLAPVLTHCTWALTMLFALPLVF